MCSLETGSPRQNPPCSVSGHQTLRCQRVWPALCLAGNPTSCTVCFLPAYPKLESLSFVVELLKLSFQQHDYLYFLIHFHCYCSVDPALYFGDIQGFISFAIEINSNLRKHVHEGILIYCKALFMWTGTSNLQFSFLVRTLQWTIIFPNKMTLWCLREFPHLQTATPPWLVKNLHETTCSIIHHTQLLPRKTPQLLLKTR